MSKKKYTNKTECNVASQHTKPCNFTFTVSDMYCTYSYPLNISSNNSVDDIAKKIYKAFKLKEEEGVLVKEFSGIE